MQVVLCALFLAINLYILVTDCQWFSVTTTVLFFFMSTCNNTVRARRTLQVPQMRPCLAGAGES